MAVVKTNFVKRDKHEKKRAKAAVRYIQHRPGKDGQKQIRTLFGRDGAMEKTHAYQIIDEAQKWDILFRVIITPDPSKEDTNQDLNMREVAEQTMMKIEEILGKTVLWTAALHAEHTDIRHVHALARVPGRLNPGHLNTIRDEATDACRQQRQELDLALSRKREREEAQWEL
jgi:hypothetical protein